MDTPKTPNVEDVLHRFLGNPGELEIVIENRKSGIGSEGMDEWRDYDLRILEKGLYLIRDKEKAEDRKAILEASFSILFVAGELYFMIKGFEKAPFRDEEAVIINLKLMSLLCLSVMTVAEMIAPAEGLQFSELIGDIEKKSVRMFGKGIGILISIIIFLDLINLIVGA